LQFLIKKKFTFFSAVIFFQFLVIKALDPYWSPTSHSGSGSGSGKNEYGSTTLLLSRFCFAFLVTVHQINKAYENYSYKKLWIEDEILYLSGDDNLL
jgi:hypothetical protein